MLQTASGDHVGTDPVDDETGVFEVFQEPRLGRLTIRQCRPYRSGRISAEAVSATWPSRISEMKLVPLVQATEQAPGVFMRAVLDMSKDCIKIVLQQGLTGGRPRRSIGTQRDRIEKDFDVQCLASGTSTKSRWGCVRPIHRSPTLSSTCLLLRSPPGRPTTVGFSGRIRAPARTDPLQTLVGQRSR